jgi:hypothetical protein
VDEELTGAGELAAALVARVRLLARMGAYVKAQTLFHGEALGSIL